jgi:enoyl-CoA hydratase
MMPLCHITVGSSSAGVVEVTLDRPPANALSPELMRELSEAAAAAVRLPGARVVLLRSAVEGMFMAGADLQDVEAHLSRIPQLARLLRDALDRWETIPLPTIAELSGHALGGGCELALVCDFRVMARGHARIGLPEVHHGLLPSAGGPTRLVRLLGRAAALDLVLRGRMLDADEAERVGLVTEACDAGAVHARCLELAAELAAGAPLALAAAKRVVREASELPLGASLTAEAMEMALLASSEDCKEGVRSFLEKRAPTYVGR